jgi:16S rRNA (adenine1518-N6/adenine1519-N6)-dimethyltransferase
MSQPHLQPRKSLGQNFLVDANIARKIVAAVDARVGDAVIEVGPGEGALTALLLGTACNALAAVEFDARAVGLLREKFAHEPRFSVLHSDVLTTRIASLIPDGLQSERMSERIKVVGNIPYYITSDILLWLFEQCTELSSIDFSSAEVSSAESSSPDRPHLDRAVIMMQKEVAERLVAKPRTKEYGVLTLATGFMCKARVLFHVSPNCFFPRPNVTSAVVEFLFAATNEAQREAAKTFRAVQPLVRLAFNQRRKMLSNALHSVLARSAHYTPADITTLAAERGCSLSRRAEELTAHDFVALHAFLMECGCIENGESV